jgi:hypothetical protein
MRMNDASRPPFSLPWQPPGQIEEEGAISLEVKTRNRRPRGGQGRREKRQIEREKEEREKRRECVMRVEI